MLFRSKLDDSFKDEDDLTAAANSAAIANGEGEAETDSETESNTKVEAKVKNVTVEVKEKPKQMVKLKVAPRRSVQHPDAPRGHFLPGETFSVDAKEAARLKDHGFAVDHKEVVPPEPEDFVVKEDMSAGENAESGKVKIKTEKA